MRNVEMSELAVEEMPTETLIPYANNAKEHSQLQVEQIANSIEEFGFNDPIAVWENAQGELEIVEGHGRVMAAKKLGIEKVPVIRLDHLSDKQRRAYTHVHNQTTLNSGFDLEALDIDLTALDFDWENFGFELEFEDADCVGGLSDDYSQNIGTVIYEPKDTHHKVSDLFEYDEQRFYEVIERIEDESLKKMLKLRAAWFTDFNFSKIADYYAYQATPDEQRAFEALGLVLLDRDQLIENGFSDILEMVDGGGSAE